MKGRVISVKLKNTATVLIERQSIHPLYKKAFLRSKNYLVDDSIGVKIGDLVEIKEIRPVSKNKYFKIVKVLGTSIVEIAHEQMKAKAEEVIEEVMPASPDANQGEPERSGDQIKSDKPEASEPVVSQKNISDTPVHRNADTQISSDLSEKKKTKLKKESK